MMFKIIPVFKDYIWGGSKLRVEYGKCCSLESVAESWELSTHPAGICKINNEGKEELLTVYLHQQGQKILGEKCRGVEVPILIKLIDAKDHLSVQVHPDDAYARRYEKDLGKTEMWYVLEAEEGAHLVCGLKEDLTKEVFRKSIEDHTLCSYLNEIEVHKGDVFFIPPGTIHAIGDGIVVAEIQESSNVTYRVYDYDRVGADGRRRQLHIQKALEVIRLKKAEEGRHSYEMRQEEGAEVGILVSCEYFTVKCIQLKTRLNLMADRRSFHHLLVIGGEIIIKNTRESLAGRKGESFFVPAGTGSYTLEGSGEVLLTTL